MGKNRKEPCKCGHFHTSKEIYLDELTGIDYMDMLVTVSKWEMAELGKQPTPLVLGGNAIKAEMESFAAKINFGDTHKLINKEGDAPASDKRRPVGWIETPHAYIKKTPAGDIVIQRHKKDQK